MENTTDRWWAELEQKMTEQVELENVVSDYSKALDSKSFVDMANVACRCISKLSEATGLCSGQFVIGGHFGLCPECRIDGECLHVGRDEWFVCHEHKVKWFVGSNLFSGWRTMTDEEFAQNEELLKTYKAIEPLFCLEENGDMHRRAERFKFVCSDARSARLVAAKRAEDDDVPF
ncbi:MAG: hypothetical protein ACYTBJ_16955 [Planctomycetota bacterium]|jgi:hypothetical protein